MSGSNLDLEHGGDRALPSSVEGIVAALRELAVSALDAGQPMIAAQIAGTADRVEAEALMKLPPRPDYGRRTVP